MRAANLAGFVAGLLHFTAVVGAILTVTVRVPVGLCEATDGLGRGLSGTATAVTSSLYGVSLVSPTPISASEPSLPSQILIIPSSVRDLNGCSYGLVGCYQEPTSIPSLAIDSGDLTVEYCADYCTYYAAFGVTQGGSSFV
jgi:hypothetical protein